MATQTVTETITIAAVSDITEPSKAYNASTMGASQVQPLELEESAEQSNEAEPDYPTGAHFWVIFASLAIVLILGGLDTNIVATAVPSV